MDDLDTTRCRDQYATGILKTLEQFGLQWDEPILYQSTRNHAYAEALETLKHKKLTYPCSCTRKQLQGRLKDSHYDGYCLVTPPISSKTSTRIKLDTTLVSFEDQVQGTINKQFEQYKDDFIVRRKDNIYAYQLAVCVDDEEQNISEVLRGNDLLADTPSQIMLQQLLGLNTPLYAHIPVIVDRNGAKLSKQTFASDVSQLPVEKTLVNVLALLCLNPPTDLLDGNKYQILDWAVEHWSLNNWIKQQSLKKTIIYNE